MTDIAMRILARETVRPFVERLGPLVAQAASLENTVTPQRVRATELAQLARKDLEEIDLTVAKMPLLTMSSRFVETRHALVLILDRLEQALAPRPWPQLASA